MTLILRAPVTCPECAASFRGVWETAGTPADQACPQGHVFSAVWPRWPFKPETVIRRHDDPPESLQLKKSEK